MCELPPQFREGNSQGIIERNKFMPITSLPIQKQTTAYWLGDLVNGSPEWHEARANGIGGSEVGTIAGLNKWESAFTLWAKKCGLIPSEIAQSEAMEAGSRLESFVLDWFAELNPELDIDPNVGTYQGLLGWDHANPDAIYRDGKKWGIIEVKTARFEDDWVVPPKGVTGDVTGVPKHYATQVQWYLRIMGLQYAKVVVLFGGQKLRWYEIDADTFQQGIDLALATQFWACVEKQEHPGWDGSTSTFETVRALNPDIEDKAVELPDGLWRDYSEALFASRNAEVLLQGYKTQVLAFMGNARSATFDGVVKCVRQAGRNGAAPFLVNKDK
jgi:putative phage-type endonuclease